MAVTNHTDIASDGIAAIASHVTTPDGQLDAAIGDRATLTTAVKTSLVAALNEVKAAAGTVLADNVVTQSKIADAAVGPAELHASVAGNGLVGGAGTALAVNVDNVTVEVVTDALRVKDGGVTGPKIATSAMSTQNLVRDGFNRALAAGDNDQRERWLSPTVLSRINPDAANPYGLPTTRFLYVVSGSTNGGRYLYLDEMGVAVGDVLNFAADVLAASGTYDLRVQCYTSALVAVPGGTFIGTTTTVNTRTRLTTPQVTIPATTTVLGFYVHRVTGTVDLDIYAMWAGKGTFAATIPQPSVLDGLVVAQHSTPLQIDDPFNADLLTTASLSASWGGRLRWQNAVTLSAVSPDANNPYGLPTLRFGTGSSSAGKRFWLDELGAKVGDTLHFGIEARAVSDQFRLAARFFDAAGAFTGTQISGVIRTFADTMQKLTVGNAVVPAGAAGIAVYGARSSGSVALDIYSMWGSKGLSLQMVPAPTLSTHVKAEIVAARGAYADLDARLDAIVPTTFAATSDEFGRHLLRATQAQIAKIQQAVVGEQLRIAFIGDSWVDNGWIYNPLWSALTTLYGSAGAGWISANTNMDVPVPVISGVTTARGGAGAWTLRDNADTPVGYGVDIGSAWTITVGRTKTFTAYLTNAKIHYLIQPSGGDFTWQVDAGTVTTVSTAGTLGLGTVTIPAQTAGSHTITIAVTVAGTAGVELMGVHTQALGVNGVEISKFGNGGGTTGQYATAPAPWDAGVTAISPHLVIVELLTNDDAKEGGAPITPAAAGANLTTIVNRIQAAAPLADILLVTPSANGLGDGTYPLSAYVDQMRAVAVAKNVAMLDMYLNVPSYADANTRGLMLNTSHLNANGGQLFANRIVRMIKAT